MRYMLYLAGVPALLLVAALAMLALSSHLVVKQQLHELALGLYYVSILFCVAAVVVQFYNCKRVWQASQGIGTICRTCDKPATRRNGGNGPYQQCWQCGHNETAAY